MLSGHWAILAFRFYFHPIDGVKLHKLDQICCFDSCPSCPSPVRLTWRNTRSMWHPKFEALCSRRFRRLAFSLFNSPVSTRAVLFLIGIWIETFFGIWHILLAWGRQYEMNWSNCMTVWCGRFGTLAWNSQNSSISALFSTNMCLSKLISQKHVLDCIGQKLPNLHFQKPMSYFLTCFIQGHCRVACHSARASNALEWRT